MRSSSPENSIANNCSHGAITREEEAELTEDDFAQLKGLRERFSSEPPVVIDFEKGTCLEQRIITACKLRLPDVDPKIFTVREHKEPGAVIAVSVPLSFGFSSIDRCAYYRVGSASSVTIASRRRTATQVVSLTRLQKHIFGSSPGSLAWHASVFWTTAHLVMPMRRLHVRS